MVLVNGLYLMVSPRQWIDSKWSLNFRATEQEVDTWAKALGARCMGFEMTLVGLALLLPLPFSRYAGGCIVPTMLLFVLIFNVWSFIRPDLFRPRCWRDWRGEHDISPDDADAATRGTGWVMLAMMVYWGICLLLRR